MAAGRLIFPGFMPAEDANGNREAGALAYFYTNLTNTLGVTYTTSALNVPNTNPVEADGVGVWPAMWADTANLFTVALTDAAGVPMTPPWDGVGASIDATLASTDLAESAQAAAEAAQVAAEAAQTVVEAIAADLSGEPYTATSLTSLSIGTGTKVFTLVESGKLYAPGQTVVAASIAAPLNNMTGTVISLNESTRALAVSMAATASPGGVGPYADWSISLSSAGGVLSVAGLSGVVSSAGLKTALALASTDISDFNTAVIAQAAGVALALGRRR